MMQHVSDEGDQEQLILEEEIDENYEPTEAGLLMWSPRFEPGSQQTELTYAAVGAEILEYAHWLGMDLDNERVSFNHTCRQ